MHPDQGPGPLSPDELVRLPGALLQVAGLPWPTPWPLLFGRAAPLLLEVGFGRGEMLFHLAGSAPHCNVVGIEISGQSLRKAERRLARGEASNLKVVQGSAEAALQLLFEPASLAEVHINFPDPWFKKRHSGRRLVRKEVVDIIANRLVVNGTLHVATDIEAYASEINSILERAPAMCNELASPWVGELPGRVQTKYEAFARVAGRPRHFMLWRRKLESAPFVAHTLELGMPNLILHGIQSAEELQERFRAFSYAADECSVRILGAYRDDQMLLLDTFVQEPVLSQRLAITIAPSAGGGSKVSVGRIGMPRPTIGLHHAVAAVARWLAELSPGARLVPELASIDRVALAAAGWQLDGSLDAGSAVASTTSGSASPAAKEADQ